MAARFRVLITDRAWSDTSIEQGILAPIDGDIIEPGSVDEATLVRLAPDVDAIATNWARVTEAVIRRFASRCQIVSRFGIGVDNIAVNTATECGIPVTNCPDYCVSEVSDHALGLLLAYGCQTNRGSSIAARNGNSEYNLSSSAPMQSRSPVRRWESLDSARSLACWFPRRPHWVYA